MGTLLDLASLVVVPSGYKTSKVYSVKPTDGSGDLDFTRSNDTATRVNSAGLIEKVRTNLALYSEQFDNVAWVGTIGGTGVLPVVTSNNATAPDGTMTADTIVFNAGAGTTSADQSYIRQIFTLSSAQYTGSFYARVTSGTGQLLFRHAGGGTYTTANLTTTWQRFSSTETGSTGSFEIGLRRGLANEPINASVTVEMWGAQLEVSDFGATDYIPTTSAAVSVGMTANVPRLDYSGGGCPKLLLEPQRTNTITFSENVTSCLTSQIGTTVTGNATTSPDGYQNADLVAFVPSSYRLRNQVVASSTTYTMSLFFKNNTFSGSQTLIFNMSDGVIGGLTAQINVANGTAIFSGSAGAWTSVSGKVKDYGNGWYRVSVTGTSVSGGSGWYEIASTSATASVYIWGLSLEIGAYATSYIPTLGAAVTRGADACSKTGISSLIGQTEGTLFAEFKFDSSTFPKILVFTSVAGSFANAVYMQTYASDGVSLQVFVGGANQVAINYNGLTNGQTIKIAAAYKANDFVLYVNGVQAGTDTSGSIPSGLSQVEIGTYAEAGLPFNFNTSINQAILFPTRLTNTQLQELTTL